MEQMYYVNGDYIPGYSLSFNVVTPHKDTPSSAQKRVGSD